MSCDYFRDYESPRFAELAPGTYAACFSLMKMMAARFMLERAIGSGRLRRGGHVVETTSGTFGLAIAMLAAAHGYKLTLVTATSLVDPVPSERLAQLGAHVAAIEDPRGDGNQKGRLDYLQNILATDPSAFWPCQYDNPENRLAYSRLAEMAVRRFGQIDRLVGCVGTGGSLCGTGGFLRELNPDLRIVGVDTHRSVLFGQAVGRRMLRGLGNSVLPANVRHEMIDEIHWVGALVAYASSHRLLSNQGIFMGPTSGAAAAVGQWVARAYGRGKTLIIMPDEGHRYAQTVYSRAWLTSLAEWPIDVPDHPRPTTVIEPARESEWTCFDWRRRALEAVVADHSP
jgi:cysteine synthase A